MFQRMLDPFDYDEWRHVMKMLPPFRSSAIMLRRRMWLNVLRKFRDDRLR